jgi:hypothetical protein
MEKIYTQDALEELELVECCKHCGSLGLKQEVFGLHCPECGVTNYSIVITLEEWEKQNHVNC